MVHWIGMGPLKSEPCDPSGSSAEDQENGCIPSKRIARRPTSLPLTCTLSDHTPTFPGEPLKQERACQSGP